MIQLLTFLAVLTVVAVVAALSEPEVPVPIDDPTDPTILPTRPQTRPEPLEDAARDVDRIVSLISGPITGLVAAGTLSAATGNLLIGALGLLLGLAPVIASRVAAYRTAAKARNHVTPLESPADVVDGVLTALVPAGRHTRGE